MRPGAAPVRSAQQPSPPAGEPRPRVVSTALTARRRPLMAPRRESRFRAATSILPLRERDVPRAASVHLTRGAARLARSPPPNRRCGAEIDRGERGQTTRLPARGRGRRHLQALAGATPAPPSPQRTRSTPSGDARSVFAAVTGCARALAVERERAAPGAATRKSTSPPPTAAWPRRDARNVAHMEERLSRGRG